MATFGIAFRVYADKAPASLVFSATQKNGAAVSKYIANEGVKFEVPLGRAGSLSDFWKQARVELFADSNTVGTSTLTVSGVMDRFLTQGMKAANVSLAHQNKFGPVAAEVVASRFHGNTGGFGVKASVQYGDQKGLQVGASTAVTRQSGVMGAMKDTQVTATMPNPVLDKTKAVLSAQPADLKGTMAVAVGDEHAQVSVPVFHPKDATYSVNVGSKAVKMAGIGMDVEVKGNSVRIFA